jgi:hypothetical protein
MSPDPGDIGASSVSRPRWAPEAPQDSSLVPPLPERPAPTVYGQFELHTAGEEDGCPVLDRGRSSQEESRIKLILGKQNLLPSAGKAVRFFGLRAAKTKRDLACHDLCLQELTWDRVTFGIETHAPLLGMKTSGNGVVIEG